MYAAISYFLDAVDDQAEVCSPSATACIRDLSYSPQAIIWGVQSWRHGRIKVFFEHGSIMYLLRQPLLQLELFLQRTMI